jgi:rod shape-determining protein MreD
LLAFIVLRFGATVRFCPLTQPPRALGGLLHNDRVVGAAMHYTLGEPQLPWSFWWAPLLGMLLWGPLFLLLDGLRLGRRG